jgi:hypothetical protein
MSGKKKPKYNDALKLASNLLSDLGTCTHYPGYTCDKGFPEACPACIKRWLLNKARGEKE